MWSAPSGRRGACIDGGDRTVPDFPESPFATIPELGAALRDGRTTSRQLTEYYLERCEQVGPKFNAVVTVTRDRALQEADRADRELGEGNDRGPLHGIPYGVKDLLATAGTPTSWGAAPLKDQTFESDATAVRRLADAGAVLVAKLSMVELAGGLGYDQANASFNGPGLNPWDPTRWSGGSSSGPGSAVAAGIVPFAIGTETWGSIVTPAAYCGVSGLRPTYGRISRHGAMALSWTMDKLGPMCRTAHDCGLVLAAVAGADPEDDSSIDAEWHFPVEDDAPQRRFRLAELNGTTDKLQQEVADNYQAAREVVSGFADIEPAELPDWPYEDVAATIVSCEAATAFEELVRDGRIREMTAEEDRWRIYSDLMIPARDYINAQRLRRKIQRALDEFFSEFDAVISPTLSTVAGPIDQPFHEWSGGFTSTSIGGASNAAGIPAISVPNGFGEKGLPTGLQFVGRAFDELTLLRLASAYQQQTDWHTRHPEI